MSSQAPKISDIRKEVSVTTARSSGPGGQHVNKVETKVVLRWNVKTSVILSNTQKDILLIALEKRLTNAGEIIIGVDNSRSQVKNKTIALKQLDRMLTKAFLKKKKRLPTKPSKNAQEKRMDSKKKHGEKKALRKRVL